jgi:hypothetical protein
VGFRSSAFVAFVRLACPGRSSLARGALVLAMLGSALAQAAGEPPPDPHAEWPDAGPGNPTPSSPEDAGGPGVDGGASDRGGGTTGDVGGTDADELTALKQRVQALEEQVVEAQRQREIAQRDGESVKAKVKELAQAIQFSGFFDVSVSTYENNPNLFDLGTFEFDIKKEFGKYFQVGAALVFADKQSDLAVGFIDFHLFGGLIPARGNVFLESGFHLQVGRFDVTLGNDWQYFASIDRQTMSAPLTTTVLMDGGYNDVGFRVLGNHSFINYAGYVLEGAEHGVAVGGRIALVPLSNPFTLKVMENQPLDIGVGFLNDFSQGGKTEQRTYSADLEARWEFLHLQSEYYWRRDHVQALRRTGYQLSLFGTFLDEGPLPFGFSSRFDEVRTHIEDGSSDETLQRMTVGCFARPFEVTVMKLEFARFLKGNPELRGNSLFAQLVIGFK